MVLKLYGSRLFTCTRRVAAVLHEKQVPFTLVEVDWKKGEHKSPEYLEKQPFGQVPYIDDDGFILYESRAICNYLDAKYPNQGTRLVPTELRANALYQQAASIEMSHFNDPAEKAVTEMVFKPAYGQIPDQAAFEIHVAKLKTKLEVYDKILSKQRYLAGDEVTLADLYHLPYGYALISVGSSVMEELPNVDRWFKDISSRPSWQTVKDGVDSTACGGNLVDC
ncbi:glutathione S-transferase [Crassisporium funariophilum]|nr:glutathione S-transferase [Crassisporium funariophilum]